jgi:hypothetical protein
MTILISPAPVIAKSRGEWLILVSVTEQDRASSQHDRDTSSKRRKRTAESREQLVADLIREIEEWILSDTVFNALRTLKKVTGFIYPYLQQERRRKKRSKEFQWLIGEIFRPQSPVDSGVLVEFKESLLWMRNQLEGSEIPSDSGEKFVAILKNFTKTRGKPKYWREYLAYLSGRTVSQILREFHPQRDRLQTWEREKYFRKVYNAIQRLVEKYGGPPLPPNQSPS